MAIKLKQYLENSWYRWASQDRQSWYAAQFQYWENVNIRDMKNGVCLSWWATDIDTIGYEFTYFTYSTKLIAVDKEWQLYDVLETWLDHISSWDIWKSFTTPPNWIEFNWVVYVVWSAWIFRIGAWVTDLTPQDFIGSNTCVLNYANTFLLIWDANCVWRLDKNWLIKKIREFDYTYKVYWLTQEWNYLKIYVSDWFNTKIHYAKGTFDVEDTWLVQTVTFNWLSISNDCVTSDQGNDYVCFMQNKIPSVAEFPEDVELKLAKISWYNKTDIRRTQTWDWEKIFYWTATVKSLTDTGNPIVLASDWVLFTATYEWIWTFTEYNWWLWWGCLEFREDSEIISMFRFGERLYVCMYGWSNTFISRYYDLSFHPNKYQTNGFIIGRVFDWGCAWLFKKNDQATITYNMPTWTSMELSYRYDRDTFTYDKSNFYSIKKLEDTNNCYDIVVPTTPQVDKQESLLRKEEVNDLILLENWNWILLEDMMVCPFNKTWNLLEYRFDLKTTNTAKTPTLYEHSLTYYDYMRKYR